MGIYARLLVMPRGQLISLVIELARQLLRSRATNGSEARADPL